MPPAQLENSREWQRSRNYKTAVHSVTWFDVGRTETVNSRNELSMWATVHFSRLSINLLMEGAGYDEHTDQRTSRVGVGNDHFIWQCFKHDLANPRLGVIFVSFLSLKNRKFLLKIQQPLLPFSLTKLFVVGIETNIATDAEWTWSWLSTVGRRVQRDRRIKWDRRTS